MTRILLICSLWLLPAPVAAQPGDPVPTDELDLEDLTEVEIVAAAGYPQDLSRAPSVATVLTRADITATGARHLDELLALVPGLHVKLSGNRGLDPVYSIRGVRSSANAQILMLLNGVPITSYVNGGPVLGFRLPTVGIERVEIVRGPGSAVYGADAFAGIINVVTRTGESDPETRFGLLGGSFGTRELWVQHGIRLGGWDLAVSFDWQEADGDDDRVLVKDLQTTLDGAFGTSASLAPGPLDTDYEVLDLHLDLRNAAWRFGFWGWRNRRGVGDGVAQALDPSGSLEATFALADVAYEYTSPSGSWTLTERFSHAYIDEDMRFTIFPPGAVLPIGADGNVSFSAPAGIVSFPDGVRGRPRGTQNIPSLESVAVFTASPQHHLRMATGGAIHFLDTEESKNFGPGVIDGTQPVVDGDLTDLTGTDHIFMEKQRREVWHVSAQDEWSFAPDWELTMGARYDDHSDFGGTFNPRLALVWAPISTVHTKLLYGSAFRAPSLGQQFVINNPGNLGNPDLEPEMLEAVELVVDVRRSKKVRGVLSVFHYDIEDLIALVNDPGSGISTTENVGDQDGMGFEVELDWHPRDDLRVQAYWARQRLEDSMTGARVTNVPGDIYYLAADWRFLPGWSAWAQWRRVADRLRAPGSPEKPLADYGLVDLRIGKERIAKNLDLAITARNLLDETGAEPSPAGIPDYPIAGRAVFFELQFSLR